MSLFKRGIRFLKARVSEILSRKRGSIKIGSHCVISRKATIGLLHGGHVNIGKRCYVHDYAMLLPYGGTIEIGDQSSVNPFCVLYGHGNLKIGKGVRIAAHVVIIPSNHNFEDVTKYIFEQGDTRKGIVIEDDVWIGAGARILDGVVIGRGAVIGAGAVVCHDVPSYAVAVGVPAKIIRYRK